MSGAWIEAPWVLRLALTLLHFVWQGGVIYAGWLICRALMRNQSTQARYLLALLTLSVMGITPVVTFFWLETPVVFHQPLVPGGQQFAVAANDFWAVVYHYYWAIVLVWLTGVCLLALRLVLGYGTTLRLRRAWEPIGDDLAARFLRLADKLRLNRLPQIGFSSKVNQAMTIGFFRPVILLPLAWLSEMTPQVLEAVVAHELSHTKRGDLWVNLLQRLAETLLFFHPAVWWISREIRLEREYCCDELAVSALGQPLEYAKSLEAIATWQLGHGSNLLATPFLGERKMNLLDRVRRVLGTDSPAAARKAWPLGLAILATPLLLWAFSLGMLPGQRTEVVAEPVPVGANPYAYMGQGEGSDADMSGEMMMGEEGMFSMMPAPNGPPGVVIQHRADGQPTQTMRASQIQLAQAPSLGPNQNQRSPAPEPSDLSPRDRAMLQMMTELRYEVMALRNEIRQMRQPEGGNHPQHNTPGPQPGGYGAMPAPSQFQQPTYRIGAPPPSNHSTPQGASGTPLNHYAPQFAPSQPNSSPQRFEVRPSWTKPEEGDKPEKKDQADIPRSNWDLPTTSKPEEGNEAEKQAPAWFNIPTAEERYSRSPPEGLLADPKKATVKAPEGSARQAEELEERLRTAQALAKEAQKKAEIARHQAEAEREHAQEKLHQTQEQLNKAALRIKELEDQAAAKAAESKPTPTED